MDVDVGTPATQYTILRIKRKRNEEPLDALVVESRVRRKKSRGGIGVFQFAQTVEYDAWQDEKRKKDIQDQVSRLARESSASTETKFGTQASRTSSPAISKQQKDDLTRRYTILSPDDNVVQPRRPPTSPPKVIASKDLPPKNMTPDFKMYDAILADKPNAPPIDSEMEKFLPMLNDYLKLHDVSPEQEASSSRGKSMSIPLPSTSKADDYVWDVFYHRPTTLTEWNETANVGTLSGLPPSITDPYDSASDSEEEDEADEDSNAEEYYKNDYPEEGDPSSDSSISSDGFHENSDHDDLMSYDDDGDDHEWR